MSEDIDLNAAGNDSMEDELTLLKQRADQMGIPYHPAIGVAKLRDKVNAALNDTVADEGVGEPDEEVIMEQVAIAPKPSNQPKMTEAEKQLMHHTRLRKEAHKLVRVRVTCMNPNKKNWPGEIISVSNAVIGTVKKFVPFNGEEGYHLPAVLLKMMKARQYQHFAQIKKPNGQKMAVSKLLPEFAIEVMNPLTEMELGDLKQRQALNHSIE